jgi:hypothetical protein
MSTTEGKTTENAGHFHQYEIDENGNGWAIMAYHPDNPEIKHKHRIVNYMVKYAQSDCYPDCTDLYGIEGAGPHDHQLEGVVTSLEDLANMYTQMLNAHIIMYSNSNPVKQPVEAIVAVDILAGESEEAPPTPSPTPSRPVERRPTRSRTSGY